jgi:PASTA domain
MSFRFLARRPRTHVVAVCVATVAVFAGCGGEVQPELRGAPTMDQSVSAAPESATPSVGTATASLPQPNNPSQTTSRPPYPSKHPTPTRTSTQTQWIASGLAEGTSTSTLSDGVISFLVDDWPNGWQTSTIIGDPRGSPLTCSGYTLTFRAQFHISEGFGRIIWYVNGVEEVWDYAFQNGLTSQYVDHNISMGGFGDQYATFVLETAQGVFQSDPVRITCVAEYTIETVPDVENKTLAAANETLTAAGFRIGEVRKTVDCDHIAGTVASQTPSAGILADTRSPVDLKIAQKPTDWVCP